MQSVPITNIVMSSVPAHGEVYSMQHYVIKFFSDLRQVCGFLPVTPVSYTNKTDRHDIVEILLKVMLIPITHTPLTPFYSETIRTDMHSLPLSSLNHVHKTCPKKMLSTMYSLMGLTGVVQHI